MGCTQGPSTQVRNSPSQEINFTQFHVREAKVQQKKTKHRFFFLNNFPVVRGLHQFMRGHVCGSLATETSVKHCVQFLPSLGERKVLVVPAYSNRFATTSFCPFISISVYPQCKHLRNVDDIHSTWMVLVFKYPLNTGKHQKQGASTYTPSIPCSYICAFLHLLLSETLIEFLCEKVPCIRLPALKLF